MNTIAELRTRLAELNIPLTQASRESGISYSWLMKFKHGEIQNPTMRRLEQVQKYLGSESGKRNTNATP